MRNYAVRLERYGIDRELYLELKYFCRQYRRKVRELSEMIAVRGGTGDGMPRGSTTSDPTAQAVLRREGLLRDTRAIEQAAIAADAELYPYILRHVTEGVSFEMLGCPCGSRQFKQLRRRFYYELAVNLNKIEGA